MNNASLEAVEAADRLPSGWLERHAGWLVYVYTLLLLFGTHKPKYTAPEPHIPHPLDALFHPDKVLHMAGFGGLMLLVTLSRLTGRSRTWARRCIVGLGLSLGFAVLNESTQGWVPGRDMDPLDLLANAMGILGVYIVLLLPRRRVPTPRPRGLLVGLSLLTPPLTVMFLVPGVMWWAVELKKTMIWHHSPSLHPEDYIFHGIIAMTLTVVLIVVWPMASRKPRTSAALTLIAMVLLGPLVELIQHFTGRGVEWNDVLAHEIGLGLAMIWWAARLTCSPTLREPAGPMRTPSA